VDGDLDLDRRTGWPAELRALAERYPREAWPHHANLGMLARLWRDRHDMFRLLGGALAAATAELREGRAAADAFRPWFVPRLQFFLAQLEGHHQVEDLHYLPLIRVADPRLTRGFDVLEKDHEMLDARLHAVADAANAFLRAGDGDADRLRAAADVYAARSERLLTLLIRHLEDEEDLIVPLILDRTEGGLGLA
jgi:hypothetical protein